MSDAVFVFVSDMVKVLLKSLSVHGESYDSVLCRLLDCKVGSGVCRYVVFDELLGVGVDLCVDWSGVIPSLNFIIEGTMFNEFPFDKYRNDETFYCFGESLGNLDDILGLLAILEVGEYSVYNDLVLGRIS